MTEKVLIVGDTHVSSFEKLPKKMIKLIKEADWVIHVGDYSSIDVLSGFIQIKGPRFRGVYGNADSLQIRTHTLAKDIIEISKKRIGITHPVTGGTYENTKKKVLIEFRNYDLDAIVYGHTHDPHIEIINGVLMINPGKGYIEEHYFGAPTSVAILEIGKKIIANIKIIDS